MSGQLKRNSQQSAKRSHPYVSHINLGESEAPKTDLSPSGPRTSSPSSAKSILSPYVSIKLEAPRKLRPKVKPCTIDIHSRFEALNRSLSCLQSTPKRIKSSAKIKLDGRWSATPKGERNGSNSRLIRSSKLESGSGEDGLASTLLDELALAYPRLIDTLRVIRLKYERRIERLSEDLSACKQTISLQKKDLEVSQLHANQLQGLLESLQAKNSLSTLENPYKRQNEFLLQVLNHLSTRGYPVQTAYAEVQKCISTANSSDSPLEAKAWNRPRLVPRLQLPIEQKPDFQAEFFAKLEEFSESWKVQVPKAHHEGGKTLLP